MTTEATKLTKLKGGLMEALFDGRSIYATTNDGTRWYAPAYDHSAYGDRWTSAEVYIGIDPVTGHEIATCHEWELDD